MDLIYFLGTLTFYSLILLGMFLVLLSIWVAIFLKTNKMLFPGLMLILVGSLESPLKAFFRLLRIESFNVDKTLIQLRNRLFKASFSSVPPKERVLFLPQCLRNMECPAKLGVNGIMCTPCEKECAVGEIKKEAEELGYKVFIATGGGLVKRIISNSRPKAVVGVACGPEVKLGSDMLSKYKVPGEGVMLLRDGCVNTIVDMVELREILRQGVPTKA